MMSNKMPLLEVLIKYNKENNDLFSMPGHKGGLGFERDKIGKEFLDRLGRLDITEVDPLDNLHAPCGVIKESQELLAKYYNVNKAYFLVNGSSSGNMISIFSAFNEYDEVLVERNCHKSVYNGLIMRKLKVIYIDSVYNEELGIIMPPDEECIMKALNKAKNPKGIILTYPNYYGISYKLEEVLVKLKSKQLKILIDGAHCAHYKATNKLPCDLTKYVDYMVLSAHKTLPSLTGSSYLLVNDYNKNVDFYFSCFTTTSPSYLLMASLDYARYYMEKYGEEDYDKLIDYAEIKRKEINNLNKVKIIGQEDLKKCYSIDKSRYLVILEKGYSGHKLLDYLRKNNIQCEMSFDNGIVLILSIFNLEAIERFKKAIEGLNLANIKEENKNININYGIHKKVLEPYEIMGKEGYLYDLDDAISKVAKEAIVPYPPGIPLVSPGEIICKEDIEYIKNCINQGISVIGLIIKDNKTLLKAIDM